MLPVDQLSFAPLIPATSHTTRSSAHTVTERTKPASFEDYLPGTRLSATRKLGANICVLVRPEPLVRVLPCGACGVVSMPLTCARCIRRDMVRPELRVFATVHPPGSQWPLDQDRCRIHDRTRRRPVEQRLRRSTLASAVRAVADPRQTVCLAVSMSANHRRLELTESCGGPTTCQCRHLATRLCRGHLRGSRSSRVSTSDDSSLLMPAGGQLATLCIDDSGQPDVPLVNWDGAVALGQYVRIQYQRSLRQLRDVPAAVAVRDAVRGPDVADEPGGAGCWAQLVRASVQELSEHRREGAHGGREQSR
ncbi:hypothetical protein OH76DRAFT_1489538 [Lentinus brumalis]|uniref:Uncharacterized protein n=1 Tax=Lentinus brumalis TaxID=2498619 RepID=A0A371CM87_9APHY|nr:hypothetical protein OH76DRAFT_1489538 [Polyporus brumalis]